VTAFHVRSASPTDAEAICRIYNEAIEDRVATLETELRTPEERRGWLTSRNPRHPVLVAEVMEPESASIQPTHAGPGQAAPATIIAWGSLNPFNPREAYRFVADFSIYVERGWRGKGAGRVVLTRLIELGRAHGFHKLVLSAFPSNEAGMALYTKLGFRTVGIYKEQGLLDGKWVDTIVMEKLL
jgi:phosphinothricin acetyltransferase